MPRPQITINITEALARRGAPTSTGSAFLVYAGATGSTDVAKCVSVADATETGAPAAVATWVGDILREGAPEVYLVRATAANTAAVTEAEWTAALDKFSDAYPPGQILIPGVATTAAHDALLAHSAATRRTALLDSAVDDTASEIETTATALNGAAGAEHATLLAPWLTTPAAGGTTRDIPPSVIVAGLAARGDARVGHANHAPAGSQSGGAGVSRVATAVKAAFTNSQLDDLHDAGVSVIRIDLGQVTLFDWVSLDPESGLFKQLNAGRMVMQAAAGFGDIMRGFLFRQIDGRGLLYAELEGALRGYLLPLYNANALYGDTPDDAFDVQVASVNTDADAAAGRLNAAASIKLTSHTEQITFNVVISNAEGAAA